MKSAILDAPRASRAYRVRYFVVSRPADSGGGRALATLPDVRALFSHFRLQAGSDAAARVEFQSLVTDLVDVRHPDANEVAGPGGTDWGIDTYVGSLAPVFHEVA